MPVKIIHPSLDNIGSSTVVRGIIDRDSLDELKTDFYQREKMSRSARADILLALETGAQLPDIDLGMRGDKFNVTGEVTSMETIELLDPVFIIDGLQRVATLRDYVSKLPTSNARLGAIIHFNTNAHWERERFHKLNASRVKVSPNILLRNLKEEIPAFAMLYGLCQADHTFPLHNRVSWGQNPGRQDLLSAMIYLRITFRIHAHLVPARFGSSIDGMVSTGHRLERRLGLPMIRENARTLWNVIDEMWGIREHKIKTQIPYLQNQFLMVLADVISEHVDFWQQPNELKLTVPYLLKKKLAALPVYDPEVLRLAGGSGKAYEALYFVVMSHINSGKRTRRLIARNAKTHFVAATREDDDDSDSEAA